MRHARAHRDTGPIGSAPGRSLVIAALLVWALLAAGGGTLAAYTNGTVTDTANTTATARLAWHHTYAGGVTCSADAAAPSPACPGSLGTTAPSSTIGQGVYIDLTNDSTIPGAQLTSQWRALSCAPVQFSNRAAPAVPMLARYGTYVAQPDPWGGTGAISLTDELAYASAVARSSLGSLQGVPSYTIGVWFRVDDGYRSGGGLMSLTADPANASVRAGAPMLWLDTLGRVQFRLQGGLGTLSSGRTSNRYNDGAWHLAMLTRPTGTSVATRLVVDTEVVTGGSTSILLSSNSGYWHLGWGDFTRVSQAPQSPSLVGSLAGAFMLTTPISPATESALLATASGADYTGLLSDAAHLWMLDDDGTGTWSGELPVLGATPACQGLTVAWSGTAPVAEITPSTSLDDFADGSWRTVAAPDPGGTQLTMLSYVRGPTWDPYLAGLWLRTPIQHRVHPAGATSWTLEFSWSDSSMVFLG
ncbi:MAG: hypothetical protein ACK5MT_14350 [Actinomycetales bacterium]